MCNESIIVSLVVNNVEVYCYAREYIYGLSGVISNNEMDLQLEKGSEFTILGVLNIEFN